MNSTGNVIRLVTKATNKPHIHLLVINGTFSLSLKNITLVKMLMRIVPSKPHNNPKIPNKTSSLSISTASNYVLSKSSIV